METFTLAAETFTEASTNHQLSSSIKKKKLDDGNMQRLSKAKTELTNVLTTNAKEKIAYEIKLLKATLQKKKIKN